MFSNEKLRSYVSSYETLNIGGIDVSKGDEEDVNILFCRADKSCFSCIEEFYAAIVKIEYSYPSNKEALSDFVNAVEDAEVTVGVFSEAVQSLGEWNIGFQVMDEWLKNTADIQNTYIVSQGDGHSEYLFECTGYFVFSGISI